MPNYKKMYFAMAARMADAMELLAEGLVLLAKAQRAGEDSFCKDAEPPLLLQKPKDTGGAPPLPGDAKGNKRGSSTADEGPRHSEGTLAPFAKGLDETIT